jgi:hypothetical protein
MAIMFVLTLLPIGRRSDKAEIVRAGVSGPGFGCGYFATSSGVGKADIPLRAGVGVFE